MISPSDGAYVWAWLPGAGEPVVAGRLQQTQSGYRFGYGESYLARSNAISLYASELPLRPGWIDPPDVLDMAGCLWDSGPDAWGQRTIIARLTGKQGRTADRVDLSKLTFLLESGSDRIGALDFQRRSDRYVARTQNVTLDQLHGAARALDDGELNPMLAQALVNGTSIGGARPKVTLVQDGTHFIAKLSTSTDTYPVVKAEAAGLELARRVGIDVTPSMLTASLGREVLLVERFDRPGDGARRMIVSALTVLGLDEFTGARYGSYPALLDELRRDGTSGHDVGRALFERIVFNIAIGNTDDHTRNHAAFWDGTSLELTPAYDLCPQSRSGTEVNQAMDITRSGGRASQFALCVDAAPEYGLTAHDARDLISNQIDTIRNSWDEVADIARLTTVDSDLLFGRQILNPYALEGFERHVRAVPTAMRRPIGAQPAGWTDDVVAD